MNNKKVAAAVIRKILEAYRKQPKIRFHAPSVNTVTDLDNYKELLGEGVYYQCLGEAYRITKQDMANNFPSELKNSIDMENAAVDESKSTVSYKIANRDAFVRLSENGDVMWHTPVILYNFDEYFISDYMYHQYILSPGKRQIIIPEDPEENPVPAGEEKDPRPVCGPKCTALLKIFGEYAFGGPYTLSELAQMVTFDRPPVRNAVFSQMVKDAEGYIIRCIEGIEPNEGTSHTVDQYMYRLRFMYMCIASLSDKARDSLSAADINCLLHNPEKFFAYESILDHPPGQDAAAPKIMQGLFKEALESGKNSPITELDTYKYIMRKPQKYGISRNCRDPIGLIAERHGKSRELAWLRECGEIPADKFLLKHVPVERMKDFLDSSFYDGWEAVDMEGTNLWYGDTGYCPCCAEKGRYALLMMHLTMGPENAVKFLYHVRQEVCRDEFNWCIESIDPKSARYIRRCYREDSRGNYVLSPSLTDTQKHTLRRLILKSGCPLMLTSSNAIEMFSGLLPNYSPAFASYMKQNADFLVSGYVSGKQLREKQEEILSRQCRYQRSVRKSLGYFTGWHKQPGSNVYHLDREPDVRAQEPLRNL